MSQHGFLGRAVTEPFSFEYSGYALLANAHDMGYPKRGVGVCAWSCAVWTKYEIVTGVYLFVHPFGGQQSQSPDGMRRLDVFRLLLAWLRETFRTTKICVFH